MPYAKGLLQKQTLCSPFWPMGDNCNFQSQFSGAGTCSSIFAEEYFETNAQSREACRSIHSAWLYKHSGT